MIWFSRWQPNEPWNFPAEPLWTHQRFSPLLFGLINPLRIEIHSLFSFTCSPRFLLNFSLFLFYFSDFPLCSFFLSRTIFMITDPFTATIERRRNWNSRDSTLFFFARPTQSWFFIITQQTRTWKLFPTARDDDQNKTETQKKIAAQRVGNVEGNSAVCRCRWTMEKRWANESERNVEKKNCCWLRVQSWGVKREHKPSSRVVGRCSAIVSVSLLCSSWKAKKHCQPTSLLKEKEFHFHA